MKIPKSVLSILAADLFFVFFFLGVNSASYAQSSLARTLFSTPQFALDYDGWFSNLPADVQEHHFDVQAPLFGEGHDTVAVSAQGTWLHFNQPYMLSTSGTLLSTDLWSLNVGGQFTQAVGQGQQLSERFSIGSSSDHPFANASDTAVNVSGFYIFPDGATNKWLLSVYFSNNSSIANYVPIPGFGYMVRTPNFTGIFGFPFIMLQWVPMDPWSLSLSAFGPNVNSEIALGKKEVLQGFVGFNWGLQSFLPENRPDVTDRLYFTEKKVFLGTRFPVSAGLTGEIQCGYMFNLSLYEGTQPTQSEEGTAAIESSLFAELNLKFVP